MTRQKKIQKENEIECFFYLYILRAGAFDYWLDRYIFTSIARSCQCSPHLVKKVFFKKLYPNETFRMWLSDFEY